MKKDTKATTMEDEEKKKNNNKKGTAAIESDPYAELPVQNFKYVKDCRELYLGHRNIEVLKNFEKFVNVEVLWLNGNKLKRITGLNNNFRIKHLYIYDNSITTLEGSISKFKFLETLHAFNNNLCNLDSCLKVLSKLAHLKTLDLFGNPVAEEENYRERVIEALSPTLTLLDRRNVKSDDLSQEDTQQRMGIQEKVGFGEFSGCAKLLFEQVEKINLARNNQLEEKHDTYQIALPHVDYKPFKPRLPVISSEQLQYWERYTLHDILQEYPRHTPIEKPQLEEIFEKIKDCIGKQAVPLSDYEPQLPAQLFQTLINGNRCEFKPLPKNAREHRAKEIFQSAQRLNNLDEKPEQVAKLATIATKLYSSLSESDIAIGAGRARNTQAETPQRSDHLQRRKDYIQMRQMYYL